MERSDRPAPNSPRGLRGIGSALDRVKASLVFIAEREAELAEARLVRNRAVRALVDEFGPAATSRMTGIPLPSVKVWRHRT